MSQMLMHCFTCFVFDMNLQSHTSPKKIGAFISNAKIFFNMRSFHKNLTQRLHRSLTRNLHPSTGPRPISRLGSVRVSAKATDGTSGVHG